MPLTTIDPKGALVPIELQKGVVDDLDPQPDSIEHIFAKLGETATTADIPDMPATTR